MDKIMAVISLLFFIALIVGLIKPSAVLWFMKTKTRGRVFLVYGLPFFLIPFFSGLMSPSSPSPQPFSAPQVSEQNEAPRTQDHTGGITPDGISDETKDQPVKTIDFTQGDLFQNLAVQRDEDGRLKVVGKSSLPEGTKLWVTLGKKGQKDPPQEDGFIDASHNLISPTFSPYPEGEIVLKLEAVFNGAWQTKEVLAITGEGGINLPLKYTRPDDPEFPNAERRIESVFSLIAPPIAPHIKAIEAVKKARLMVQGRGRSSESVEKTIEWFASTPGIKPVRWFADKLENDIWKVTLIVMNGEKEDYAEWEYNAKTRVVRYTNPNAKIFSYLPPE